MSYLKNFKLVNIYTKSNSSVPILGIEIYRRLKIFRNEPGIIGVYFTHYYSSSLICIGFQYTEWKIVKYKIKKFINELKPQNMGLIDYIGDITTTSGKYYLLPSDIAVDYIICKSFDWLVKMENEFGCMPTEAQKLVHWLMINKMDIFKDVIFSWEKKFTYQERFWILERFIHHLLNAGLYGQIESVIFAYLNGIKFFDLP